MQYEIVFKSDRMFMLYFPSSKFFYCCSKGSEEGGSWYSSGGSMSTHNRNAKNMTHTCTYMQTMAKDKKQYNNTVK
jgi:hypothetical protein